MNALSIALGGLGVSGASTLAVIAQAASGDPSGIAPYVGGGAGVIAVGALGEVTRRLLNGSLVPRATREHEHELGAAIVAAGQREDRAMRVAEDTSVMVVNASRDLRVHNERVATDLAKVTKDQAEHVEKVIHDLARVIDDLRDEVRELKRGAR